MAYEISRKSPIGELVLNCPAAASVLLEHGFHCIGCGLSAYETLEEGAAAHGFDDSAIDALVKEIQDAAKREEGLLNNPSNAKEPKNKGAKAKKPKKPKTPPA
jgi:hybrid cluster-associated redox disulfide protein